MVPVDHMAGSLMADGDSSIIDTWCGDSLGWRLCVKPWDDCTDSVVALLVRLCWLNENIRAQLQPLHTGLGSENKGVIPPTGKSSILTGSSY